MKGCTSIWLVTSGSLVTRVASSSSATVWLATPMWRVSPARLVLHKAPTDSAIGTFAFGQWMSRRSTDGRPSFFRLSSTERSKSPAASLSCHTLVVTKTSSRLMPEARRPFADLAFVAVHLRGIEMPVALPQRGRHRLDAHGLLQRHRPHADRGNARAVDLDSRDHAELLGLRGEDRRANYTKRRAARQKKAGLAARLSRLDKPCVSACPGKSESGYRFFRKGHAPTQN